MRNLSNTIYTKALLAWAVFFLASAAHAVDIAPLPNIDQNFSDLELEELASSKIWRSLLRAEPGTNRSKVVNSDFFLAEDGYNDLTQELKVSVQVFFLDDSPEKEQALCKFPARYTWLRRSLLDQDFDTDFESCSEYWAWSGQGQTESISLFYANGYFENPASFFGHVLIRLNESNATSAQELLATAIDYGALIPPEDRGLTYMFKGVFGFYDAGFSDTNFYRHNHNYGNDQLRDLWEYRLPLSSAQVDFLVLHLWELMSARQTYYFLSENCGTAINDLLQVIGLGIDSDAISEPWFLPADIFIDSANLSDAQGNNAVTSFKPSLLSMFHRAFRNLSTTDKQIFAKVVRSQDLESNLDKVEMNKSQFVDLLLSYYEIRLAKEYRIEESEYMQQQLLLARLALPIASEKTATYADPEPFSQPHQASPASMVRVSAYSEDSDNTGLKLQYRPVQFDSLGLKNARPEHANLTALDTEIEFSEGKWTLRNIDLIRIRSLNSTETYLPADWPISWEFRIRAGEKLYGCQPSCFNASAEGGIGKAISVKPGLIGYVLVNAGYQTSAADFDNLFIKPTVGILYDTYRNTKFGIEYFSEYTDSRDRSVFRFDVRQQFGKYYDLRFTYQNEEFDRYEMGLSYFF